QAISGISRHMVLPAGITLTQAPLAAVLGYTAPMAVPVVLPPTTRAQEPTRAADRFMVPTALALSLKRGTHAQEHSLRRGKDRTSTATGDRAPYNVETIGQRQHM